LARGDVEPRREVRGLGWLPVVELAWAYVAALERVGPAPSLAAAVRSGCRPQAPRDGRRHGGGEGCRRRRRRRQGGSGDGQGVAAWCRSWRWRAMFARRERAAARRPHMPSRTAGRPVCARAAVASLASSWSGAAA